MSGVDALMSMPVYVSNALPMPPSTREWARRIVRHGLADVLEWLGEDVGPAPDDQTHAIRAGRQFFVSPSLYETLQRRYGGAYAANAAALGIGAGR